jgi:HSP20 family molecular chaperone IbpA
VPRVSVFSSPLLLGFEQVERMLEQVSKSGSEGYPPYNIEQISPDFLRISLAVAGFKEDHLSVTVEDSQLVIRGRQEEECNRTFIHKGIAQRQFQKAFVLADGMEIGQAFLDSGLLNIDLTRPQPTTVMQTIKIEIGAKETEQQKLTLEGDE